MFGWSIIFLVIAAIAAFLGYGGVATQFAAGAKLAFFAGLALFIISLLIAAVPRDRMAGGARGAGMMALGALLGVGVYLWVADDMSAERIGESIDRGAAQIATDTAAAATTRTIGRNNNP
jgi:uncharacterized membrane protein YtjA (UPF0391 family)